MKIGLVVDGEAEYRSLPSLYPRLCIDSVTVLNPLLADIQPLAPVGQIASSLKTSLKILRLRQVGLVIVLLDRETRSDCPGDFAAQLCAALGRVCSSPAVQVVIKNRQFENWLVADLDALAAMPARFRVQDAHRRQVAPNKADHIDALVLIKSMIKQRDYDKKKDAVRIFNAAEPLAIARNSRSFRRFLRLIGHPQYAGQSKRPT